LSARLDARPHLTVSIDGTEQEGQTFGARWVGPGCAAIRTTGPFFVAFPLTSNGASE
jgi:hypothetical protein